MLDGSKFSKYLKMAMKSVNPKLDAIHRRRKKMCFRLDNVFLPLIQDQQVGASLC